MAEVFNACTYLVDRHVAAGAGARTAVAGPRGTLTYAELLERTERVAGGLRALRMRPEERVLIFMSDSPDMVSVILGAMRMGAVPVPVSTMLSAAELADLLRDSRLFPLGVGASVVLEPAKSTPEVMARRLAEERPSLFFAVPTFYAALLAADL